MHIIFLDIDAVICTRRSCSGHGKKPHTFMLDWDRESCGMIANLCKTFGFKIVISSTWRLPQHRKLLIRRLKQNGLYKYLIPFKNLRYTPIKLDFCTRHTEITLWIAENKEKINLQKYFILDDDDSCRYFENRWIKTEIDDGFSYKHFKKIYEHMISAAEQKRKTAF